MPFLGAKCVAAVQHATHIAYATHCAVKIPVKFYRCGPVRLAPDPDAERAALLAAVQEMLTFAATCPVICS